MHVLVLFPGFILNKTVRRSGLVGDCRCSRPPRGSSAWSPDRNQGVREASHCPRRLPPELASGGQQLAAIGALNSSRSLAPPA
jgi:hypothetical protein